MCFAAKLLASLMIAAISQGGSRSEEATEITDLESLQIEISLSRQGKSFINQMRGGKNLLCNSINNRKKMDLTAHKQPLLFWRQPQKPRHTSETDPGHKDLRPTYGATEEDDDWEDTEHSIGDQLKSWTNNESRKQLHFLENKRISRFPNKPTNHQNWSDHRILNTALQHFINQLIEPPNRWHNERKTATIDIRQQSPYLGEGTSK